jgi:hypothetical protein
MDDTNANFDEAFIVFDTTLDPMEDPKKWLVANLDDLVAAIPDGLYPRVYSCARLPIR